MEYTRLLGAALLLATASCSEDAALNQSPSEDLGVGMVVSNHVGPDTLLPDDAQGFANTTASAHRFGMQVSRLAAARSQSEVVRTYAADMITAHKASEAKLKMTLSRIAPTIRLDETTLTAEEQSRLHELQSKSDAAFDRAYIGGQVTAHENMLKTLEAYAAVGDNATLSQLAKETIPSVSTQLRMARRLL